MGTDVPGRRVGTAQAVVFDMDGVVTDTATVHAEVWRRLFDDFFVRRHPDERAFSSDDYRRYVDGRARIEGVTQLLRARGIELPLGDANDPPGDQSAWALANRKNELFVERVERSGVEVFPSTVALIRDLRALGRPTALVTASRNADRILAAAGADDLFDAQVDGTVAEARCLAGKPDAATFLEAVRLLGATPQESAVIEDSLAGVEAGRRGRFGLVVGVDRMHHADALRRAGADVVVDDLAQLSVDEPLRER
jgi:HAD superfamily hydrolase (TIGR01509 family)